MRSLLTFLAWVGVAIVAAQEAPRWSISAGSALMWQGSPYVPIGLRIAGTPESVLEAADAGVKDVVVELSAAGGWGRTISTLEEKGMRYLIAISDPAPRVDAVIVEPESYRVPGIAGPTTLEAPVPDGKAVLIVLASQRTGQIERTDISLVSDGVVRANVDPGVALDHVALLYPLVSQGAAPDFWEGCDRRRDAILKALAESPPGPGFRGLIDPLGQIDQFESMPQAVPVSPMFRLEFEAYLRRRYATVETVARAWGISAPDFASLAEMARLVPLWSDQRGVGGMWDPDSGRIYYATQRQSAIWTDIRELWRLAGERRFFRLMDALRERLKAPVLQTWRGWSGPYGSPSVRVDGIAAAFSASTPNEAIQALSRPASSVLGSANPRWFVVSDLQLTGQAPGGLSALIDDALSIGARAIFVRAPTAQDRQAVGQQATRPGLEALANQSTEAVFFPEAALNPAAPMRLAGGRWWLPSPSGGNRLDLGDNYAAYLHEDRAGPYTVLWSLSGTRRVKLRYADASKVVAEALDGSDLRPRTRRNTLEIDLGPTPVVLRGSPDFPVPEDSFVETAEALTALFRREDRGLALLPEEEMSYKNNVATFERNPAGSYAAIRLQLTRLRSMMSSAIWIEAETSREHRWSDVRVESGNSAGAVLRLRTRIPSPAGFTAKYGFSTQVEGEYEFWIAARLPREGTAWIAGQLGDQVLRVDAGPLSFYGSGLAWYRLGTVSLGRGTYDLTITAQPPLGAEIALDALVLSPTAFRPNGIQRPR